ncbi:MAG: RNA repair transcriptional activator RtcR family protein [Candidatus Cloacimonetes bacterium]|nr:RNA repair transcriptional activator RtcR family protein [Candidatus Cloacimonadota bacterium]
MKKILLTFIGNNDCLLSQGKEGAILSILQLREFDALYILYNDTHYLQHASEILLYCRHKYPQLTVRYQEAESINPIDYNIVYPAMIRAITEIQKEEGIKDVEYTISLTSGTPTMHSCWVLIAQGGIIPARLIQVSREQGISEIDFKLDDFPKLENTKAIKIQLTQSSRENKLLKQQLNLGCDELLGEHESISQVKQQIANLVKYEIPVFISGESGTGKEVVAKLLHYHSPRKEQPFIAVNCGSISPSLFESEFFGHKKGSFTGAIADHEGYFSQANGGTLFLDEIGDLPLPMQVKLLRVLESGSIMPVGGKAKTVKVNIISASNKDLKALVQKEEFREDLFYRLVQYEIDLIPLRARGTDIILLVRHFLKSYAAQYRTDKRFSPAAEKKLLNFSFPGNVRQLQNLVKLAFINSMESVIQADDLMLPSETDNNCSIEIPTEGIDLDNVIIPAYYNAALKKAKGNAAEAARLLGLKPHTFRARIRNNTNGNNIDERE